MDEELGHQKDALIEGQEPAERNSEQDATDPYAVINEFRISGPLWSEMNGKEKILRICLNVAKIALLLVLLYLFVCSLGFMSSAFRLLGGKTAGEVFAQNRILANPIAGLMIGLLVTVLVQSSSTSTSIVVAMVASKIISVRPAIPIIMGANIGTSITNTFVSFAQVKDRASFRRAFAGAVVHDMFNMLSVVVLLPLELISGFLYRVSDLIVTSMKLKGSSASMDKELLEKITKPLTDLVVQIDKTVIERIAQGDKSASSASLIRYWCDKGKVKVIANQTHADVNVTKDLGAAGDTRNLTQFFNATVLQNRTLTEHSVKCRFLFHDTGMSDSLIGIILFVVSLLMLCFVLISIVKLLHSMLRGQMAKVIKKCVNANFPKPFGFLTGYFAIVVGACMTMVLQSSSIFTSVLTPLVGFGIVSIDRIFPLTIGANIGTTCTSVLAALASPGDRLGYALQIAFCHLLFNLAGTMIWYPLAFMRNIPISLAKSLGNTTSQYRWFAVAYILIAFFAIPAAVFALSMAGQAVFISVLSTVGLIGLIIGLINILQTKAPGVLPKHLRTWNWAPKWSRSLEPYDGLINKLWKVREKVQPNNSAHTPILSEPECKAEATV